MWERVREAVGHLIERLEDPDRIFKVNTIESVRELVTLLPGFNTTNDPRVTPVVTAIERMLKGIGPEKAARKSGHARRRGAAGEGDQQTARELGVVR